MTTAGAATLTANPSPFDGSSYLYLGGVEVGYAEQAVDLIAAGFTAEQLDSRNLEAVFSGRIRSTAETPVDRGRVILTFQTEIGAEIASTTVSSGNPTDRWELVGDRVQVPTGTRRIVFRFAADRESGSTNNSYLDYAFLKLVSEEGTFDQGAYGNTVFEQEVPQTHLALRFPDLYTDWELNKPHIILWDTYW